MNIQSTLGSDVVPNSADLVVNSHRCIGTIALYSGALVLRPWRTFRFNHLAFNSEKNKIWNQPNAFYHGFSQWSNDLSWPNRTTDGFFFRRQPPVQPGWSSLGRRTQQELWDEDPRLNDFPPFKMLINLMFHGMIDFFKMVHLELKSSLLCLLFGFVWFCFVCLSVCLLACLFGCDSVVYQFLSAVSMQVKHLHCSETH